jgi:hypothetical protein
MTVANKTTASGIMRSPFSPPEKRFPAAACNDIRGNIFDTIGLWSDAIETRQYCFARENWAGTPEPAALRAVPLAGFCGDTRAVIQVGGIGGCPV